MSGADTLGTPFARLGLRDLVLLAAWELGDEGQVVASRALLEVAASIEADQWVVSGRRTRLLRALIDAVPPRDSVRAAIEDRLL
jgi:hypothetical protein